MLESTNPSLRKVQPKAIRLFSVFARAQLPRFTVPRASDAGDRRVGGNEPPTHCAHGLRKAWGATRESVEKRQKQLRRDQLSELWSRRKSVERRFGDGVLNGRRRWSWSPPGVANICDYHQAHKCTHKCLYVCCPRPTFCGVLPPETSVTSECYQMLNVEQASGSRNHW